MISSNTTRRRPFALPLAIARGAFGVQSTRAADLDSIHGLIAGGGRGGTARGTGEALIKAGIIGDHAVGCARTIAADGDHTLVAKRLRAVHPKPC